MENESCSGKDSQQSVCDGDFCKHAEGPGPYNSDDCTYTWGVSSIRQHGYLDVGTLEESGVFSLVGFREKMLLTMNGVKATALKSGK